MFTVRLLYVDCPGMRETGRIAGEKPGPWCGGKEIAFHVLPHERRMVLRQTHCAAVVIVVEARPAPRGEAV